MTDVAGELTKVTMATRVAQAASVLPARDFADDVRPLVANVRVGAEARWHVHVSPGSVRLSRNRVDGWEFVGDPRESAEVIRTVADAAWHARRHRSDLEGVPEALHELVAPSFVARRDRAHAARVRAGCVRESVARARITGWSAKSRRNSVCTMATLDWEGVWRALPAGWRVSMITLTYPGEWAQLAPSFEDSKRHLQRFRKALERRLRGPVPAVWKLEFQARGAPHYHLLVGCPADREFREWVSSTWTRVIFSDHPHLHGTRMHADSLAAGTQVNYKWHAYGHMAAIAYFSKHNAPGGLSDKEYQHRVPVEWSSSGTGRWWGIWRTRKVVSSVKLDADDAVQFMRLLRSWDRSRNRTRRVRRERRSVDRSTGEIWSRERMVTKRAYGMSSQRSRNYRTILVDQAPDLVLQLARGLRSPIITDSRTPRALP